LFSNGGCVVYDALTVIQQDEQPLVFQESGDLPQRILSAAVEA
jgi:hypothetical protein